MFYLMDMKFFHLVNKYNKAATTECWLVGGIQMLVNKSVKIKFVLVNVVEEPVI